MHRFTLCAALFILCATQAAANDFPPITNHSALASSFALPALGETLVLAPGHSNWQAVFGLSNEFEYLGFNAAGNCVTTECLIFDGESYRLNLRYRGALARGWDWSFELPLLAQSGGFMDNGIETWHGWFGLPNNGREFQPRARYLYSYRRGGPTGPLLLNITEPANGIGDLALGLGRQLGADTALRVQIKLPTGDEAHLAGGNFGGALWLDAGLPFEGEWHGYFSAGVSVNDRGEILPEQQNRIVALGGFGLSYQAAAALALHAQIYLHSPLYDESQLRALRHNGAVLGLGGRYRWSKRLTMDLSLLEDTNVNVSPDFGVQLNLIGRALK